MRQILQFFLFFSLISIASAQEWERNVIHGDASPTCIAIADINNDGIQDVAAGMADLVWYEKNGESPTEWTQHTVLIQAYNVEHIFPTDFDGDGDIDLLSCNVDDVTWHENLTGDGTDWNHHLVTDSLIYPYRAAAADIDGDGDLDVVAGGYIDENVYWYENDGSNLTFEEHFIGMPGTTQSIYLDDLDSDNDVDVIVAGISIRIWINHFSDGSYWSEFPYPNTLSNYLLTAFDVDNDDDLDFITEDWAEFGWAENVDLMNSDWDYHSITSIYDDPRLAAGADMDLDGDTDLVIWAIDNDDPTVLTFWENENGSGTDWNSHGLTSAPETFSDMKIADMDGDSDPDIVAAASEELVWFEQPWSGNLQLEIMEPNGGEVWRAGTSKLIRWRSTLQELVSIDLLRDGIFDQNVVEDTTNDGVFAWPIPDNLEQSDSYTIRIRDYTGTHIDTSDAPFAIDQPPLLTATPENAPVVIPAEGGGLWYWVTLENSTLAPVTGALWVSISDPDGEEETALLTEGLTLPVGSSFTSPQPYGYYLTGDMPAGYYRFDIFFGTYPQQPQASTYFVVEKSLESSLTEVPSNQLPTEFRVGTVYPNPFNSSACIDLALPEPEFLTVRVFNVSGQLVQVLEHRPFSPGIYSLAIDGSGWGSGLYFVRVQAGEDVDQTRKVLLVR
ncbi:VCBS repeat-containing protein [bacterium]|nr:VCBS repeat-containing protein [bacterium]